MHTEYIEIPIAYAGPNINYYEKDNDLIRYGWTGIVKYLVDALIHSVYGLYDHSNFYLDRDSITLTWNKDNLYRKGCVVGELIPYFYDKLNALELGFDFDIKCELNENNEIKLKIIFDIIGVDSDSILGLLRIKHLVSSPEDLRTLFMTRFGFNDMKYSFTNCASVNTLSFPKISSAIYKKST